MKSNLICLLALNFLFGLCHAFGQRDLIPAELKTGIPAELFPSIENAIEEQDWSAVTERFEHFKKNPFCINSATIDDFQKSGLFNAHQIDRIFSWREETGAFLEIFELQAIPEFTLEEIKKLLPFICIDNNKEGLSLKKEFINAKTRLSMRNAVLLEKAQGYSNGNYLGNRFSQYLRYKKSSEKFSLSVALEKDPGEPYLQIPKIVISDFTTFHLRFPWKKWDFILGDYSASFGQGLILMQDFVPGKSPLITELKRIPKVIKTYSSRDESSFFRGAAVNIPVSRNISVAFLQSARRIDGNILVDSLSDLQQFSAFQFSGLHRTKSEISDKKSVKQFTIGSSVQYQKRNANFGWQFIWHHLNKQASQSGLLYRKYAFAGRNLLNSSINYSYILHNINFFGESGISDNGALGTLNGLLVGVDKTIQVSFLYRYFSREFHSMYASAMSETAGNNNEKGLYWGVTLSPLRKIKFENFLDLWKHPWLKYQTNAPSVGQEYLCKMTYKHNKTNEFYLQFRYSVKEKNQQKNSTTNRLGTVSAQQLRLHFSAQITAKMRWQCRAEFSDYRATANSKGSMLYTDLHWRPETIPISLNTRFCIFSTSDFDSRIYAFENSFYGSFALTGIYGKGRRYYVNLKYTGIKDISIECRLSQTYTSNSSSSGSGNDFIMGNKRTEIGLQINYQK